jgi:hypothetical protein
MSDGAAARCSLQIANQVRSEWMACRLRDSTRFFREIKAAFLGKA